MEQLLVSGIAYISVLVTAIGLGLAMHQRKEPLVTDENTRRRQVGGRYWKRHIQQQIEAWRTVKEEVLHMLAHGEALSPATIAQLLTLCDRSIDQLIEMQVYEDES